jgi:outer membrane immunogenic protein
MRTKFASLLTVALCLGAAQAAFAADMPVKAPVYKVPPAVIGYNWTGFYAGVNAGYGGGDTSFNLTGDNEAGQSMVSPPNGLSVTSGSFRTSGFIGGGQLGYNWQFNRTWLAGLEADIDYSNIRGSGSYAATAGSSLLPFRVDADRKLQWLGTLRARLGVLPTDRLLIFATGGLAYGQNKASASITNLSGSGFGFVPGADGSTFTCSASKTCFAGSGSRTSAGWTVGGGVEYAILNNISLKAEYLYVNLGSQTINLPLVPPSSGNTSLAANFNDAAIQIVRVGINYKFN